MTLTLGWKSAVAAAVLVIALGLGIFFAVKGARQRSVTDWQRQQQIEGLRHQLDKALLEIDRIGAEADEVRKDREKAQAGLLEAQERLRKLQAIPAPTPEDTKALCASCLAYVDLLEGSLRLADLELLSLRKQVDLTRIALEDSQTMYEIQTLRLRASQRDKKKVKRRNIWTNVSIAAASLTLGVGIGKL